VFADEADPAFFIGLAIHAGIDSGISAEGNINMLQRLIQHRPAKLGELLTVQGQIQSVTPVPRGLRVHTDVWFEDTAGERVISCPRTSLKPQANTQTATGAGHKPQPVVDDLAKLALGRRYQLTPERVKAYSVEGNSIHYEQEAAERAGFRAPLIGGGMGVHYLTAQMWSDRPPASFDALIYFRRPIFWDEAVQVGVIKDGPNWRGMGLLKLPMADADPAAAAETTGETVTKVGTELALQSYTAA
jgi:acyl dehydratase